MEPSPTKRPRLLDSNPLNDIEDPYEDELLSLPSEINARRDPNLKLERSRQHAVFKLKSAFESIFEKYGRDFEGVGDEIDLRTGRIVVNNGHIEGMRGSELLEGSEGEDEGEEEDGQEGEGGEQDENDNKEDGGLNEEERILQGGTEVEGVVGRLGQDMMLPQMMGPPMGFNGFGGWPGMMGGGLSGLSNMMFPGQMGGFSGWPMEYGPLMNLQTSDPTWQAPALPPSYMYRSGVMANTPAVKKKRMSLFAPREDKGDNEDDILLGVSAEGKGKGVVEETPVKQKLLMPKPHPDTGSEKKKRGPRRARIKVAPVTPAQDAQKDGGIDTAQEKSPQEDVVVGEVDSIPSETNTSQGNVETVAEDKEPPPAEPEMAEAAVQEETTGGLGTKPMVMAVWSRPSTIKDPGPSDDPNLYIYISDSEQKSAKKPRNQSLRVEIVAKRRIDTTSFRAITPEQSEAKSPTLQNVDVGQDVSTETTEALAPEEKATNQPGRPPTPESEKGTEAPQKPPGQVFTRHVVDTEYDFSDEDEPMPKRKRQPQKKAGASRKKDENLLRKTLCKPLSIVASTTEATSDEPPKVVPMPDAQNLIPEESGLEDQANCQDEPTTVDLKETSRQPPPPIINTETSIPDVMVQLPDIPEVVYHIGSGETPWPKRRRGRSSFRGRDPRGEIPDSDPIGRFSTQGDPGDDIRPPSPSLSFRGEEDETMLEIPDSYLEPSSELGIPEAEPRQDHTVPSPTLSSYAPDDEILELIPFLSLQPQDAEISEPTPILLSQPSGHETSESLPDLSSQSHGSGIPETISSPPPLTPHDSNNNIVTSIEPASSPLIPKPAQAKEKPHLKLSTPSSLATPIQRPRGHPLKIKPTPAGRLSTTPTAKSTPTTSTKSTRTPSIKPTKTPTSNPPPTPATTTTKRKRRAGVLSLLSDSEDDELTLLSPSIPPITPIIRSSPASHHVRLLLHTTASLQRDALLLKSVKKPHPPRKGDTEGDKGTDHKADSKLRKGDGLVVSVGANEKAGSLDEDKAEGRNAEKDKKKRVGRLRGRSVKVVVPARRRDTQTPSKRMKVDGEGGGGEWGGLIETPDGMVRRCGEEGFVCERAFCFRCIRKDESFDEEVVGI